MAIGSRELGRLHPHTPPPPHTHTHIIVEPDKDIVLSRLQGLVDVGSVTVDSASGSSSANHDNSCCISIIRGSKPRHIVAEGGTNT